MQFWNSKAALTDFIFNTPQAVVEQRENVAGTLIYNLKTLKLMSLLRQPDANCPFGGIHLRYNKKLFVSLSASRCCLSTSASHCPAASVTFTGVRTSSVLACRL